VWKFQVKGLAPGQSQALEGIEPLPHGLGISGRHNPRAVLGQKRALGDRIQTGKQGQPGIKDLAHHVAMPGGAVEFEAQEGPDRVGRRNHRRAGKTVLLEEGLPGDRRQIGYEQKQPAN